MDSPFSDYSKDENPKATIDIPARFDLNSLDTVWVLLCGFVIFTMQIGFGLIEAGLISNKNQVNIMMKNAIDVIIGGFSFWIFGFGMSYGNGLGTNGFMAFGDYFFDPDINDPAMGGKYVAFLFQLSFATTATTIVCGAMAERTNFTAYVIFSFFNTIVYCVPAGWVWGDHGFLGNLGAVDIAGSGPVHLIGGASSIAAAMFLGPRLGRYEGDKKAPQPGNPMMVCHGFLILWFGWLAFNSGSTYAVTGESWKYCARAAVQTMHGSFGAGFVSYLYSAIRNKGKLDMLDLVNGTLGGLVGITAGCFLYQSWAAEIVGGIGALVTLISIPLFDKIKIDDPVGAHAVHGVGGIWGVLAVGLFAESVPLSDTYKRAGLFMGGGWYLLGIQALSALCLLVWGMVSTFILLFIVDKISPLRMSEHDEILGADVTHHDMEPLRCGCNNHVEKLTTVKAIAASGDRNGEKNEHRSCKNKKSEDNFAYEGRFTLKNLEFLKQRDGQSEPNEHEVA